MKSAFAPVGMFAAAADGAASGSTGAKKYLFASTDVKATAATMIATFAATSIFLAMFFMLRLPRQRVCETRARPVRAVLTRKASRVGSLRVERSDKGVGEGDLTV